MVEIEVEVEITCPLCAGHKKLDELRLLTVDREGKPVKKAEDIKVYTEGWWQCPACEGAGAIHEYVDVEIEPGDHTP